MKYRAQLVGVEVGNGQPKPYDRPVEMLTNQRADAVDWGRKTLARVDKRRWPSAMVLIHENVEAVVERIMFDALPPL